MYLAQKIELILTDEQKKLLDSQSILCTRLYNELVAYSRRAIGDITKPHRITANELYEETLKILDKNIEYKGLSYSSISSVQYNLNEALKLYYSKQKAFPKFKSTRLTWTSLFFTTKYPRIKIKGRHVSIVIGNNKDGVNNKQTINAMLKYHLRKHESIVNYRIIKTANRYYLAVSLNVKPDTSLKKTNKYVAIDLNHSNFFVAVDSDGESFEFERLKVAQIHDANIDAIKKKRDTNHTTKIERYDGSSYTIFSNAYMFYNNIVVKEYVKKYNDLHRIFYMISNYLVERYDIIAIGDYTPQVRDTSTTAMRRSMINESYTSDFRLILENVCKKHNKKYILVNENCTTSKCFYCGNFEPKDPKVRKFVCPICHKELYRDLNSAINIGLKANIFDKSKFSYRDLSHPTYKMFYHFHKQALIKYKL